MVYLKLADISVPSLVSLEGGNYDGSVSSPNTVVSPGCGTGAGVAFHCEWTALCTREIALGNMVHRSFRNHLDVRLLCTLWRAVGNFNWLSLEYFFSFFFYYCFCWAVVEWWWRCGSRRMGWMTKIYFLTGFFFSLIFWTWCFCPFLLLSLLCISYITSTVLPSCFLSLMQAGNAVFLSIKRRTELGWGERGFGHRYHLTFCSWRWGRKRWHFILELIVTRERQSL